MTHAMIPYIHDESYSTLLLGSAISPGVVTLSGHDRYKKWDTKEAKGQSGATSQLNGDPIGQFDASFYLVVDDLTEDPNQFDLWEDFQRLIESMTNGSAPIALPIWHPDLARNGFTEVSSGGVGGMIHDGRGGAIVVVKFIEYKPPKKKVTRKAKAKPGVRRGVTTLQKPDPNAKAKAELDALVEEARQP